MDALSLETITRLASPVEDLRVSLFLPTRRFGPGSQETDTLVLKNLLTRAETILELRGLRAPAIKSMLAPTWALLDDRQLWLRSREGLAVLAGSDEHAVFQLDMPLSEHTYVGHRFYVRPLLPLLGHDDEYWVLGLSQNRVQLFRGDRSTLVEEPAEKIPKSLADAMQWEEFERTSLQLHTGTGGTAGLRSSIISGASEPDVKKDLMAFFREIDRGLHEHLDSTHAPLVLAGVDYLIPLYREVSTCPSLLDEAVTGNPEGLGEQVLHEQSWAIVDKALESERGQVLDAANEQWASPRVTTDSAQIIEAAEFGRVDTLVVSSGAGWWAREAADAAPVVRGGIPESDGDLLEAAMLATLGNSGAVEVFAADRMPHGADVIALLRY